MRKSVPLLSFLAGYFLLSVIGSLLLLFRVEPFFSGFQQFAGAQLPDLAPAQRATFLVVLLGSPIAFVLGYGVWQFLPIRGPALRADLGQNIVTPINILFYVLVAYAALNLAEAGAFTNIASWESFGAWLVIRTKIFENLNFFQFVNIYTLLPTGAGVLVALNRSFLSRATPVILSTLIELLLFQKLPAIRCFVIILSIALATAIMSGKTLPYRRIAIYLLVAVAVYLAMVVIPYAVPKFIEGDAQTSSIASYSAAYAGLSIIMRQAPGLLQYIAIFPIHHPFYGLDLGAPFRHGPMPDDSAVIWRALYPNMPGAYAAPFNFAIYSQRGVLGAFGSSLIVGCLIGLLWRVALEAKGAPILRGALGGLLIAFSLQIALDSLRNAVLVSYGFIWPFLFVVAIYVVSLIVNAKRPA